MRRREQINLLGSAGAVIALLSGPASAQQLMPGINLYSEGRPLTADEQEKRKAVDDAYRSTIEKLPDKKKTTDPWGNLRSTTTTSSKRQQ
jgi:hypothetical protein